MKKDPSRYIPRPYGHAAPWNRSASAVAPAPAPAPAARRSAARPSTARRSAARPSLAGRWPWVVLAAMVVAGVSWLVYGAAAGL
jgi:hypothetical protein